MVSYASKHASQCLSDKQFVRIQCTQTCNLKTSGYMWTFSISNDCCIIGDILCVVQTCTSDPTGELQPETCISHSLIQHCVSIVQVCMYIANWYTTTPDNKTHIPYFLDQFPQVLLISACAKMRVLNEGGNYSRAGTINFISTHVQSACD